MKWQRLTEPLKDGVFLVSNNINARTHQGFMSHVWITRKIERGRDSDGTGPFWCYPEDTQILPPKVVGLRYFVNITPPKGAL